MDSPSNLLKLFGMSNQMILHNLDKVEFEYDIVLGHKADKAAEKDEKYYPQFESNVRIKAREMAQHYETFYCLEVSIRTLITEMLQEKAGAAWWDNEDIVPKVVQDGVLNRVKKELDSGISRRSDDQIDYTNFGELGEIIKKNWDTFGSIFNSPKGVERVLASLNTLRGPIAHCSQLAEDEVLRLTLSVRDWFRLMN
ncbi:Swt1 family HEPN domain-containing protein [Stutzerimonas stutzeri]|uniref:Swt1 family HEPN domain-containing protein n=1 Tax=Stutzerimonas stutzeri TaxID=316 RepID=UPI00038125BC|nr:MULTISPECIES: Swt1 family HEPN domain-containing protein [Gammaproteobacteria]